jgi:hypothetical protein
MDTTFDKMIIRPFDQIPYTILNHLVHKERALKMTRQLMDLLKDNCLLTRYKNLKSIAVIGASDDNYYSTQENIIKLSITITS